MFVKDFTYKMRPISCIDIDITSILEVFENIEVKLAKVTYSTHCLQDILLVGGLWLLQFYRQTFYFINLMGLEENVDGDGDRVVCFRRR